MKKKTKVLIALAGVQVALAGLGLVAAGCLASELDGSALWAVKHQAAWCGVGVAATIVAALIPWRVWMIVAPGVAGCGFGLFSVCQVIPFVLGPFPVPPRGSIMGDLYMVLGPVLALTLAWLRTVLPFSTKKLLCGALVVLGVFAGVRVAVHPNLQAKMAAFCGREEVVEKLGYNPFVFELTQMKMEDAIDESKWIGESEIVTVGDIPYPLTSGVLFSSAVRFGRFYPIGVMALFGLLAAGLFALWRWSENAAMRVYILVYGMLLVAPMFHSVAEAFGLAPLAGASIPLVSFGSMPLLVAGLGFGILWSAVARRA